MDRYEGQLNGSPLIYTTEGIQIGNATVPFSRMENIEILSGPTPAWCFTFNGKRMQVPYTEEERGSVEHFIQNAIQQKDLDDMMSSFELPLEETEQTQPTPMESPADYVSAETPRYNYNDQSGTVDPIASRSAKPKKPIYKKPWFFIPIAALLLIIIVAVAGGGDDETMTSNEEVTTIEEPIEETTEAQTEATTKAKEDDPSMTASQKNAYKSAQNYLDFMAFSKEGLIDQLSSEYGDGYDRSDAEFAVNKLEEDGDVDWNEQAEKSAQEYLNSMAFSKDQLIEQLESEYGGKFTHEQAVHGVEAVYDSQ